MTPRAHGVGDLVTDLRIGLSLATILPVGPSIAIDGGDVARAAWSWPLAGLLIGTIGAMVYAVAFALGLPVAMAAMLALGATIIISGGLHEDGLADTADGFGGRTREQRLEIMRDSRIGSYGVCALILSLGLRWSALAAIATPCGVLIALLLAHAAARAGLPLLMALVPPARPDGLSAGAGRPARPAVTAALLIGAIVLAAGLGIGKAIALALILGLLAVGVAWLAVRQFGGQTGDILGAYEQLAEITLLASLAALSQGTSLG